MKILLLYILLFISFVQCYAAQNSFFIEPDYSIKNMGKISAKNLKVVGIDSFLHDSSKYTTNEIILDKQLGLRGPKVKDNDFLSHRDIISKEHEEVKKRNFDLGINGITQQKNINLNSKELINKMLPSLKQKIEF